MSYRNTDTSPEICGVPTRTNLHLLNGITSELVITCSYNVDDLLVPIHLTGEGYADPVVAFGPAIAGLTATSWVDDVDDSIVHVVFDVQCPSAVDDDAECGVSVLISRGTGLDTRTDCILSGVLEIEAAPLPVVTP